MTSGRCKHSTMRGKSHFLGSSFMAMKKSSAMSRALAKGSSRSREPGWAISASHLLRAVQMSFRSTTPSPSLSTCTAQMVCCAADDVSPHAAVVQDSCCKAAAIRWESLEHVQVSSPSSNLSSMMQAFGACDQTMHALGRCAT